MSKKITIINVEGDTDAHDESISNSSVTKSEEERREKKKLIVTNKASCEAIDIRAVSNDAYSSRESHRRNVIMQIEQNGDSDPS